MADNTPSREAQISLATATAVVQLIDLLVKKGHLSAGEVAAMLDKERDRFTAMDRPAAADFTGLMADSFRGDHGRD